jgi:tetratricopeptide (TPR) repeat protein
MNKGLLRSSRFSPGNMAAASLEALFVGRERELGFVLERLEASALTPQKHYLLLVGPRGSGKTHFLALVHARVSSCDEWKLARSRLRIAYLNEEEWGVASYLDFLLRILEAIGARELVSNSAERFQRILRYGVDNSVKAIDEAELLITEAVGDATLLLMCENLCDLFQGLEEGGQKRWRSMIQRNPFWTILATTPAMFSAIQIQQSPFYGFFQIRHLKALNFENALELLSKKAIHEGKSELANFIRTSTGRARVRAIHHLAGGNHRVYVVLFDFLDKESLDDLVTPFVKMVDDLTPYYQDRIRQLAPVQRKLVEFLCRNVNSINVKEIALQCLMSQQTAAKQLLQLQKMGFVTKQEIGRNSYYELAEPLMRICIEVKDNRAEHLHLFVEFLRRWYSGKELENRVAMLRCDNPAVQFDRIHVEAAIREFNRDHREPFLDALGEECQRCLHEADYGGLAECCKRLISENRKSESAYLAYAFANRKLGHWDNVREIASEGVEMYPTSALLWRELANAYDDIERPKDALDAIDRAIALDPKHSTSRCLRGFLLGRLGRYEEILSNEDELLAVDPTHVHSLLQKGMALYFLDRDSEAVDYFRAYLNSPPGDADDRSYATVVLAELLSKSASTAGESLELLRELPRNQIRHKPNIRLIQATAHFELDQFDEAVRLLRMYIRADPKSIGARCKLCTSLLLLGRHEEVISACDELLQLDPEHWHAILEKAESLTALGNYDEAVKAIRGGISMMRQHSSGLARAAATLAGLHYFEEALDAVVQASQMDPTDETLALFRAALLLQLNRVAEAGVALRNAAAQFGPSFRNKLLSLVVVTAQKGLSNTQADVVSLLTDTEVTKSEQHSQQVASALADMLYAEVLHNGVDRLHSSLHDLREILDQHFDEEFWPFMLISLFREYPFALKDRRWGQVVDILEQEFGTLDDCEYPLLMLRTGYRYLGNLDRRELLALPAEARKVVTDLFRRVRIPMGDGRRVDGENT